MFAATNFSKVSLKWDRVFKNRPSKICGRQPSKNFKGYGLLKIEKQPPEVFCK